MKDASTRTTAMKPKARTTTSKRSPEKGKGASKGNAKGGRGGRSSPVGASPDPSVGPAIASRCVIGIDLGDRESHFCVVSAEGAVIERGTFRMKAPQVQEVFASRPHARVVLEAGGQSAWVSRTLEAAGHEVLVANPNRVNLGGRHRRKTDRIDAEQLARIGRIDASLLHPIRHRSAERQADLAMIRGRDALVRSRTGLINHARGTVKLTGQRFPSSSASAFPTNARSHVPAELLAALGPILDLIGELTTRIRAYDREIARLARDRYPETSLLTPIVGVGDLTALAYVLTLADPARFPKSRSAGGYMGLVPGIKQSGDSNPEQRISKAGNGFLRRLLVQSAQHILGPFGNKQDSDLRRFGLRLAGQGKTSKKRAIVAVARKLAVLMHRLWSRGEVYDPDYVLKRTEAAARLAATA